MRQSSDRFRRRVTLPKGVNPETVTSTISPSGVLTVMAPKMALEGAKERHIPITMAPSAGAVGVLVIFLRNRLCNLGSC